MISRLLVLGFLYAAMFLGWIGLGLFMFFAPRTFINFVRDNVALMTEGSPRGVSKLLVRVIGAGLIAFATRFALRFAELFR